MEKMEIKQESIKKMGMIRKVVLIVIVSNLNKELQNKGPVSHQLKTVKIWKKLVFKIKNLDHLLKGKIKVIHLVNLKDKAEKIEALQVKIIPDLNKAKNLV